MTSPRRHFANRRNAMLSRGPRTNEGKAKSSQNALKHGLSARHALLAGEDPNEYRRLRQGLIGEFSPQSTLERELVERMANLLWRLRRIGRFEVAIMATIEEDDPFDDGFIMIDRPPAKTGAGRNVREFFKMDFGGKISKYESGLQRQFSATVAELRYHQKQRRKEVEVAKAAPPDTETVPEG